MKLQIKSRIGITIFYGISSLKCETLEYLQVDFTFELDVHSTLDCLSLSLSLSHANSSGGHSNKLSLCILFLHRGHFACGYIQENKEWVTHINLYKKYRFTYMYRKFSTLLILFRLFVIFIFLGSTFTWTPNIQACPHVVRDKFITWCKGQRKERNPD